MRVGLLICAALLLLATAAQTAVPSCSSLQPEDPAKPVITTIGADPGKVKYSNYDSPDFFVTFVIEYSTSPTFANLGLIPVASLSNYTNLAGDLSAGIDVDFVPDAFGQPLASRFVFTKRLNQNQEWFLPAGQRLVNGQRYYFRNYKIRDSCGTFSRSQPVATVPPSVFSYGPPSRPRNVSVTINSGSSLSLAWASSVDAGDGTTTGADVGNVSYLVYYSPPVQGAPQPVETQRLTATVGGLNKGTIYQLNVTSKNQIGSGQVPVTVYSRPVDPPSVPTNVRLTVNPRNLATLEGNSEWYIEWSEPLDAGAGAPPGDGITIASYRLFAEQTGNNLTTPRADNTARSFRVIPPLLPDAPFTSPASNTTRLVYSLSARNLQGAELGAFSRYGANVTGQFVVGRPPVMQVSYSPACSPYCTDGVNTLQVITPASAAGINTVPPRCSASPPACFTGVAVVGTGLVGPANESLAANNMSAPSGWVSLCSGSACAGLNAVLPDVGFDFFVFGANVRSACNASEDAVMRFGGGGAAAYAGAGGVEARRVFYRAEASRFTVRWEGCVGCGAPVDWGSKPAVIAEIQLKPDGTVTVSAGAHRASGGAWGIGITAVGVPFAGGTAISLPGGTHFSRSLDLGADPTPIVATVGVFIKQTQGITVTAANLGGGGSVRIEVEGPPALVSAGGDVWTVSSVGGTSRVSVKALVSMATQKFKVCFTAVYGPGAGDNLRSQLCMLVHILGPNPKFEPVPAYLTASIGCSFNLSLTALDLTEASLPLPVVQQKGYFLRIVMGTLTRSSMYREIGVYSPKQAALTPDTWVVNNSVSYTFRWVPARLEEGWDYRVCFEAKGFIDGITIQGVGEGRFACTQVRVERCRFCSGGEGGTSIAQLAAEWRTNWLNIWSGNHELVLGDMVPQYYVITIGPVSTATPVLGCTLGDRLCMESVSTIATRYGVTTDDVLWWNPDLSDEAFVASGSVLQPGQEICIVPNTCVNYAHIDSGGF